MISYRFVPDEVFDTKLSSTSLVLEGSTGFDQIFLSIISGSESRSLGTLDNLL